MWGKQLALPFTSEERGGNKFWFCCRKVLWSTIINLDRIGLSANVVIDRIYQVYDANDTVTLIIAQFREDRSNNNLHPLIRRWKLEFLVLTWDLFLVLMRWIRFWGSIWPFFIKNLLSSSIFPLFLPFMYFSIFIRKTSTWILVLFQRINFFYFSPYFISFCYFFLYSV